MTEPIYVAKLTKSYRSGWLKPAFKAVDEISFSVERGKVVGLIGPNGAGKTTTIYCLLGILFPDRGDVRIFGELPGSPAANRKIGYQSEIFFPHSWMSAFQALRFYSRLSGLSPDQTESLIEPTLDRVGLFDVRNRKVNSYSKGMKQRLGLAQAMIHDPDLLILDEPSTGLDPEGRKLVADIITEEKEKGKTIFFSSHVLTDIERHCDEVVMIRKGEIILSTDINEITDQAGEYLITVTGWKPEYAEWAPFEVEVTEEDGSAALICNEDQKDRLIRWCLELPVDIRSMQSRKNSLEEIYMKLQGGTE